MHFQIGIDFKRKPSLYIFKELQQFQNKPVKVYATFLHSHWRAKPGNDTKTKKGNIPTSLVIKTLI